MRCESSGFRHFPIGAVAQAEERHTRIVEVRGATPRGSTILLPCSSISRTPVSEAGCWWCESIREIKLFAATFLSGAAASLTEKEQTIFGSVDSRSLNNAPFKGAEKVLSVYAQRIYEAIQRDGFYVRVPSGKQFYIYVLQTIDRSEAVIGGSTRPFAEEDKST